MEMENDIALIVSLILLAFFVYRVVVLKDILLTIPIIWLLSLVIVAPFNISAWRFSYESLVPLTLTSGFALYSLLPSSLKERQKRSAKESNDGQEDKESRRPKSARTLWPYSSFCLVPYSLDPGDRRCLEMPLLIRAP